MFVRVCLGFLLWTNPCRRPILLIFGIFVNLDYGLYYLSLDVLNPDIVFFSSSKIEWCRYLLLVLIWRLKGNILFYDFLPLCSWDMEEKKSLLYFFCLIYWIFVFSSSTSNFSSLKKLSILKASDKYSSSLLRASKRSREGDLSFLFYSVMITNKFIWSHNIQVTMVIEFI